MTATPKEPAPRTRPLAECPVCGDGRSELFMEGPDKWLHVAGTFRYLRCGACGTVFQSPQVVTDDLPQLYPADYFTHEAGGVLGTAPFAPRRSGGQRDAVRNLVRRALEGRTERGWSRFAGRILARSRWLREQAFFSLLDELIPGRSGLRALDVGCGAGQLVEALVRVGYAAEGIDFDPQAAARSRTGAPIHVGNFETADLPPSSYDLLVLSHSFEHMPRPDVTLARIAELLTPVGRAVLLYPNPRSIGARWFGDAWYSWDAPRHLVLAPPAAIEALAARAGLRSMVRTRNARAEWIFAASQALRAGREVHTAAVGWACRGLKLTSQFLVALGGDVGEELVVDLARRSPQGTRQR